MVPPTTPRLNGGTQTAPRKRTQSKPFALALTAALAFVLALPMFTSPELSVAADTPAYRDTSLPFEVRAADLVSRMTFVEKIDQLRAQYESSRYAPPIARLGVPGYAYWSEGLHGVARAEFVNSPTADYYNSTAGRTKLDEFGDPFAPLSQNYTPTGEGYATSFSYGLGEASSWNRDLVKAATSITSDEARAYHNYRNKGLTYWSPTMNLTRDPRWGRSEESFGEDAYLAGEMAGAFVQGMQGDDPTYLKAVATPKHFFAQSSEDDRHVGYGANLTERELREYYTYHYAKAMGEYGAGAAMSAYNAVDGVPSVANKDVLLTLARRTWGFTGYVSSDCSGVGDMNFGHYFAQGFGTWDSATDEQKAVAAAIKGGTDLDCTSNGELNSRSAPYVRWMSSQGLEAQERGTTDGAYELGYVTEADLDVALQRVFTVRFKLGEFDEPEKNPWPADKYNVANPDTRTTPEALAIAQQTSDEAVIMLENRPVAGKQVLPLAAPETIAVIGSYAQDPINGRKYDPQSRPAATSPLSEITARAEQARADAGLSAPEIRFFEGRANTAPGGTIGADKPSLGGVPMAYPANPDAPYPYPASYADGGGNYGTIAQFKDSSGTILSNMPVRAIRNLQGWTFPASYGRSWTSLGSNNIWLGQFELAWDVPANVTSMDLQFSSSNRSDQAGRWDVYLGHDKTGTLLTSSTAFNVATLNVPLPASVAGTRATFYIDYNTTNPDTGENYYQASFSPEEEEFIRNADAVIVYAGQGQNESGANPTGSDNPREGNDRGTIQLPKGQDEMIVRATELNPETVVYMQGDNLVDVTKFKDKVAGLFWTTFDGQFQSQAMARILWGDVNPSGKTANTWYATNDDLGWITDYQLTPDATHNGLTYMYYDGKVSYPFGYGLSYSKFSYSNLRVSADTVQPGTIVDVSVDVTNQSTIPGQEVVQLYVTSPLADGIDRPRSQLKGFDKVEIGPNQTQTVTIPLDTGDMWFWDPVNDRETFDQGQWKLWVGGQSIDGLSAATSGDPGLSTALNMNGTLKPEVDKVVAIPDGIVLNTAIPDTLIHANLSATRTDQSFYDLSAVEVEYTSSDQSVAQVDDMGAVKAVGPGAAVITASVTADGSTKSTTFPVIVHGTGDADPVPEGHRQALVDFPSQVVPIEQAQEGVQFSAAVVPAVAGTTYSYSVSYYTDNTANAAVSPAGAVTATDVGTARVNVVATIPVEGGEPLRVSRDAVITVIPPVTVGSVAIDGTARVGDAVTAEVSGVSPAHAELSYRWLIDGVAVAGAATGSYTPVAADVGKLLSVEVTASATGFTETTLVSAAVKVAAVDKTALQADYTGALALSNKDGQFTEETWAAFQVALADAKAVLANPDATQTEVDAAEVALTKAVSGLVRNVGIATGGTAISSTNALAVSLFLLGTGAFAGLVWWRVRRSMS